MTTKFQEVGEVKTYSNAGSEITAGSVVVMSGLIGVAITDIAATTGVGAVKVTGVFANMPKVSGAVFAVGEKLLWDVSAGKFDDSAAVGATGDVMGGAIAWEAGGNGETVCTVLLTPGNSTVS